MSEFEKKVKEYKSKLSSSFKIEEIDLIRAEVFGKNGIINLEFKKLGELSVEEKKLFAAKINKIKQDLLDIYNAKSVEILDKDIIEKIAKEKMQDLNAIDLEGAKNMVKGSAVSMGMEVVG